MTTPTRWRDIVQAGRLLGAAGLTPGTTGNISFRTDSGILTSATGTRLGALTDHDWSIVDEHGAPIGGSRPTKESALHAAVYRARPDVSAIVHLHSPAALAVSCISELPHQEPLPAYTPYYVMRVTGLTVVAYARPGDRVLGRLVAESLTEGNAALLRRHGLVTVGATLDDAMVAAEELESACDLHLRLRGFSAAPLSADEIADLRASN